MRPKGAGGGVAAALPALAAAQQAKEALGVVGVQTSHRTLAFLQDGAFWEKNGKKSFSPGGFLRSEEIILQMFALKRI